MSKKSDTPASALKSAEGRFGACRSSLNKANESAEAARAKMVDAEALFRAARRRLDDARLDHADSGGKGAKALETAQERHEKHREALATARTGVETADRAVEVATRALTDAEGELAEARRAVKVEELRTAASHETLRAAIDEPAKRAIRLRTQLLETLGEVDAAHAASFAAADELRAMGEVCEELSPFHLAAPFIEHALEEDPGRASGFVWTWRNDPEFRSFFAPCTLNSSDRRTNPGEVAVMAFRRGKIREVLEAPNTMGGPESDETALAQFADLPGHRTYREGLAAMDEVGPRFEAERRAKVAKAAEKAKPGPFSGVARGLLSLSKGTQPNPEAGK